MIAGARKGIALRCGRGPFYRPTAQIVRGSIFDTLGDMVAGSRFLDLFAGSGAVGIEALSRGARHAVFVEQDHRILRALRTNLERCRFGRDEADVRMIDAVRYLSRYALREDFDIIFADPPYASALAQRVVAHVEDSGAPICRVLVVEHGQPITARDDGPFAEIRTRKFGQTFVTYYTVKHGGTRNTTAKEE